MSKFTLLQRVTPHTMQIWVQSYNFFLKKTNIYAKKDFFENSFEQKYAFYEGYKNDMYDN
jgi:hypothetical protein